MEPLPESIINPQITDALELIAAAKNSLTAALSYAQYKCEHRFVSQHEHGRFTPPERICNHCRLIERGTDHSSQKHWSKHDHGVSVLGNITGRIVLAVSVDQFDKMRVKV